jgi:hypothetical protein
MSIEEYVDVSWERSLSSPRCALTEIRVALRAASFFPRDDGVLGGCNGHANTKVLCRSM